MCSLAPREGTAYRLGNTLGLIKPDYRRVRSPSAPIYVTARGYRQKSIKPGVPCIRIPRTADWAASLIIQKEDRCVAGQSEG